MPKHFVGIDIDVFKTHIDLSQKTYADSLPVDSPRSPIEVPLNRNVLQEEDKSKILSESEATQYRSLLGTLAHLRHTRIDLKFALSFFGRGNREPTDRMYRLLYRTTQYAKSTANLGIRIPVKYASHFILTAWSDASLGSYINHAQEGFIICVNDVPISWRSNKQERVCHSSVKAEADALHSCIDHSILLMYFIHQLKCTVDATIFSDSLDLIKLLSSDHPHPRERHMLIQLREMQKRLALSDKEVKKLVLPLLSTQDMFQFYSDSPISLRHIAGPTNPADAFTKPVDVSLLLPFMTKVL